MPKYITDDVELYLDEKNSVEENSDEENFIKENHSEEL